MCWHRPPYVAICAGCSVAVAYISPTDIPSQPLLAPAGARNIGRGYASAIENLALRKATDCSNDISPTDIPSQPLLAPAGARNIGRGYASAIENLAHSNIFLLR
jgi:hypothetical protein